MVEGHGILLCKTYKLHWIKKDLIGVVGEEDFGCSILESGNHLGYGIKDTLGHLGDYAGYDFHSVRPLAGLVGQLAVSLKADLFLQISRYDDGLIQVVRPSDMTDELLLTDLFNPILGIRQVAVGEVVDCL